MYCKNCGAALDDAATVCHQCGREVKPIVQSVQKNQEISTATVKRYCAHCGKEIDPKAYICVNCGCKTETTNVPNVNGANRKSKLAGGLLGIFLGMFGVHNFYLGYTGKAVAQLLISVCSLFILSGISSIWGLVEGVMILAGNIAVDGKGNPLGE